MIPADLAQRLKAMVGFRNRIVHDDQSLDLVRVRSFIRERLDDFLALGRALLQRG